MAYDGSITFETAVDTSGFSSGTGDINKQFQTIRKGAEAAASGLEQLPDQLDQTASSTSRLADIVKGGGVFTLIEKGVSAVVSSLDSAIDRYDTMNRFPLMMQQLGYGADEAQTAVQRLSEGIQGLPTTLDSVVSTAQRLTILTGNLDGAVDTTLALNNAFLASGSSSDGAARGLEQYVQALSRGKFEAEEWKTMQETMGLALTRVAESFGYAGESAQSDLYAALQSGEITMSQFNSRLANKTVKNGYHILNLVTNEKQRLIAGDGKDKNSNYSGFLGSALFDSSTGTMIVGGQNGVLYTAEFGPVKDTYNYQANEITLSETIQGYKTQAKGQDRTDTNINASVAVYNNYVYYGDIGGILQCVDLNTLTPVWAVDTGDSIESTPALDVEDGSVVALYTANAIVNGGKNGVCTIRRINALTGAEEWAYEVPDLVYASKRDIGVYASPVVGQGAIRDLVIFTATNDEAGAKVIALSKADGKVVWQTALESATLSSPVAVYNEDGDAWLIQAESNGKIHLMDATDGSILDTLTLTGGEGEESTLAIEGSPAVYGNLMIIGTTGKDAGGVYCIKIE